MQKGQILNAPEGGVLPGEPHGAGADDEQRPLRPEGGGRGQGLDRLAEAHVVGDVHATAPLL